jgi:hypothetical protein
METTQSGLQSATVILLTKRLTSSSKLFWTVSWEWLRWLINSLHFNKPEDSSPCSHDWFFRMNLFRFRYNSVALCYKLYKPSWSLRQCDLTWNRNASSLMQRSRHSTALLLVSANLSKWISLYWRAERYMPGQGRTEICGRSGQANNLAPLQTDIL